ncbi:hypothetical protein ASD99_19890 [Mesorhizobium sp. Root695]|uniref:DUF1194 domain-containing protein n=1 Tax=unclassified Mesorhizobium TaxID=325217 RepID=UPI0006F3B14F|nr:MULTISPECIES: DUF1194 domain-containing protein [unclassified Mesorhizobium]KQU98838.1 hypothetical protein ASD12_20600 [Mesorhizobium sp. Root102]KRB33011.1 hypothetical protein ASD99_19890 [Mesorhizobium sp. Root695]
MFGNVHQDVGALSALVPFQEQAQAVRGGILKSLKRSARGPAKQFGSYLRLVGTLAASVFWGPQAHAANVDVAIVFAVDFSSSIDPEIADLQREGHAAALTSPEIIAAITRNYVGCISVAYFEWSSPGHTRIVLPWTSICGLEDAKAAASVISKRGDTGNIRRGRSGTSVSSAIDVGSLLLDQFPGKAAKKVIDISSNGENNDGLPVQPSRLNAIAKGYTINAIAIPTEDENPDQPLASYFAKSVIGGSQAFVITPKGPNDYAVALRRKLVTEVSMNVDRQFQQQADGRSSQP